jgi:RimJ/RimL family protein N-acetyltransferase
VRLLYGHDRDVAHFVACNIPHMRERVPYYSMGEVFGPCVATGVLNSAGTLIAGVVYHNYDPFSRNIEMSCASITPRWGSREIFSTLLSYCWDTANCARITSVTPRRSPPGATSPRRFLEGLGFVREGSIRRGFGSDNAIVYGLLREDWERGRFCRPRAVDGGEISPKSAAAA